MFLFSDILIYGKKNTQDPIAQTKIEVSGQLSLLQMFVIDVPDNGKKRRKKERRKEKKEKERKEYTRPNIADVRD